MKEHFRATAFTAKSKALIAQCNEIILRYQARGLRMTLRQLYYQLVTINVITNAERSYKNLSNLVSDARLAGEMDWAAIEDRVRVPRGVAEYSSPKAVMEAALYSYRLPRWDTQPNYCELWVEKDAIANVLWPIAADYHVRLMVNRGYSSQSAMYEASKRFLRAAEREKRLRLFYLGDHDPSGMHMVKDITERFEMYGVVDLKVVRVALTKDQIDLHKPPPNPVKVSDPRAAAYCEEFGDHSWEVDALGPDVLDAIVRGHLKTAVAHKAMQAVKAQEEKDRALIEKAIAEVVRTRA